VRYARIEPTNRPGHFQKSLFRFAGTSRKGLFFLRRFRQSELESVPRERATECRRLVAGTAFMDIKRFYLDLASDWEFLAVMEAMQAG
jgi:hypothetical protein